MNSERKLIASFFTTKQTTIDYYQKGDQYFFQDGIGKAVPSSSTGDIEKAKHEISQIYKMKLEEIKKVS